MDIAKLIKNSKPAYDRRKRHGTRKKALEIFEFLGMHGDRRDEQMALMYRISHVALGNCANPHEGWDKELNDLWEELRGKNEN